MGEMTTKRPFKALRKIDPTDLRVVTPPGITPRVTPVTELKPKRSPGFELKMKLHIKDDDELVALPSRHIALPGPEGSAPKSARVAPRRRTFDLRMVLKLF
jgi:hypothetical protein